MALSLQLVYCCNVNRMFVAQSLFMGHFGRDRKTDTLVAQSTGRSLISFFLLFRKRAEESKGQGKGIASKQSIASEMTKAFSLFCLHCPRLLFFVLVYSPFRFASLSLPLSLFPFLSFPFLSSFSSLSFFSRARIGVPLHSPHHPHLTFAFAYCFPHYFPASVFSFFTAFLSLCSGSLYYTHAISRLTAFITKHKARKPRTTSNRDAGTPTASQQQFGTGRPRIGRYG